MRPRKPTPGRPPGSWSGTIGGTPGNLDYGGDYRPGDPPPDGYTARHEWAEAQHKAGIWQSRCPRCVKFVFPQETDSHACGNPTPTPTGGPK